MTEDMRHRPIKVTPLGFDLMALRHEQEKRAAARELFNRAMDSRRFVQPIDGRYWFDDVTGEHLHCLDRRMVAK